MYYDRATYTPLWVAYPLKSEHLGTGSKSSWEYSPLLSTDYQVNLRNNSYNDGYARGHLIPNASRNGIEAMQLQTYYVTNSVPQVANSFNGSIWNQLEGSVRNEVGDETIYVVTGVAFNKKVESKSITYTTAKDDTKNVPVPNYFYKLVLKVKQNGDVVTSAKTVGFWMENKAYDKADYGNDSSLGWMALSAKYHCYSVDKIEEWTGFDFFANLPDDIENSAEQNSSWSTFQSF